MAKVVAGSICRTSLAWKLRGSMYLGLAIMFCGSRHTIGRERDYAEIFRRCGRCCLPLPAAPAPPPFRNVEAQTRRTGVPESIASFAASLARYRPKRLCRSLSAMLAVMVAPTVGISNRPRMDNPRWWAYRYRKFGGRRWRQRGLRRADCAACHGLAPVFTLVALLISASNR